MTTAEMLEELREVLADELPTYGFSDLRALAYLNEGQEKFCEDTGFFTDISSFSIVTEADVASYVLDQRIIRIEAVYSGDRRLSKIQGHQMSPMNGEPLIWDSAVESGKLRVWPTPVGASTLTLHVWRYPIADMKLGMPAVNPEIPKRMHRACIEWAAFKCYGHHNVELEGSSEALKHKAEYRKYVLEGRTLKRNMDAEQIEVGSNPCYQVTASDTTSGFRV